MFEAIQIDRDEPTPLYRQVYAAFRDLILSGSLLPQTRLPSTRAVAAELSVSRNTIVAAFEQLAAEGFIELKLGVGTRVCDVGQSPGKPTDSPVTLETGTRRLGERGRLLARPLRQAPSVNFDAFPVGVPDLENFPRKTWARLVSRHSRLRETSLMGYGHAGGYAALREGISSYLRTSRGVRCLPDQVIVMSSAQAGMDLAVRLLVDAGDKALVEEPGYPSARAAIEGAGLTIHPITVDDDGFDVESAIREHADAKLICVTPSHQFPTGVTLSVARRLALLEFAQKSGCWIVEDDYDSEFHYNVRPIPSLQGLADSRQVLYVGTFAKTLLPGLRIAYLVVPPDLTPAFTQAVRHTGQEPPLLIQAALADFIAEGHFSRHLRRMRRIYALRREALVDLIAAEIGDSARILSVAGGMQLAIEFDANVDDTAIAARAKALGVTVLPLSQFCATDSTRRGLILGFASTRRNVMRQAIKTLATLVHD